MSSESKNVSDDFQHLEIKDDTEDEIRILLIGKTGTGKSRTGNTILGTEKFKSKASMRSVTHAVQFGKVEIDGKQLMVVDSPGFCDLAMKEEDIDRELRKCVQCTAPGLHAFVLVIGIGRFTNDDHLVLQKCKEKFGDHMEEYLIVLFTHYDDIEREEGSIEMFLSEGDEQLLSILEKAKNRYIALNNNAPEDKKKKDVLKLKYMTQRLIKENKGNFFTNKMYQEVEEAYQKKKKLEAEEMKRKEEEEKEKHLQEIRKREVALQEERDMFEKKKAEAEAAALKNMKELEEKYEKEKKDLENKVRECKEEFEKEKMEQTIRNMQDEYQNQMRFLRESNEQIIRKLDDRLQQKEREAQQEREGLQNQFKNILSEMRESHKKDLEQFREEHREAMKKLRDNHDNIGCTLL